MRTPIDPVQNLPLVGLPELARRVGRHHGTLWRLLPILPRPSVSKGCHHWWTEAKAKRVEQFLREYVRIPIRHRAAYAKASGPVRAEVVALMREGWGEVQVAKWLKMEPAKVGAIWAVWCLKRDYW